MGNKSSGLKNATRKHAASFEQYHGQPSHKAAESTRPNAATLSEDRRVCQVEEQVQQYLK